MDLLAKDDCIDAWLGNDHKYGPAAVEAARNTTRSGHTVKPAFGIPNQTCIGIRTVAATTEAVQEG